MGRRKMESQKRSVAALFSLGFAACLVFVVVFEKTFASNDERVVREQSNATTSNNNTLPMSREMSAQLVKKDAELKERERQLEEDKERLKVEEQRIQKKIDHLLALQEELKKAEEKDKKIREEVKQKLVKTFEKMAPKKAAPIIANLEDKTAVELLLSFKDKTGAQILEGMDPARATVLSKLISEQGPAPSSIKEGQSLP